MSAPAHVRIDEGVKRGPRQKPSDLERQARNEAGKFLTRYTPELKAQAVAEALTALEVGARVEEVADKHGIPVSTMYSWLVGTEASSIRTAFFDGQAMRNLVEMRRAKDPLELARAREEFGGWIKVAAVRDSGAWGPKQEVKVDMRVTIDRGETEAGSTLLAGYIEGEVTQKGIEHNANSQDITTSVHADVVDVQQTSLDFEHEK